MNLIEMMLLAGYLTGIWYWMDLINPMIKDDIWFRLGVFLGCLLWPVWVIGGFIDGFIHSERYYDKEDD